MVVNPGCKTERHLLKTNALPLEAGEVIRTRTGGGGGFGPAWERDPMHVRDDVIDGYVSRQGAACDYGVVLRDDLSLDAAAIAKR